MTCPECGVELQIGDHPFCPHGRASLVVEPDDIPGGEQILHCPGLHGRWVYSKRERARLAAEKGFENRVYWTGEHERHVQRMVAVDLTDYDDPEVVRARQEAMARHCGLTLEAYLALRAQPVLSRCVTGSADEALNTAIAEQLERLGL